MAISAALGERGTVEVPAGVLEYRERGSGPPVVFVHGAAVNGDLWRKVAPELAENRRCIVPDLPLGGHSIPLNDGPDLSLFGAADLLASFLAALDLTDVALVANDTGGAISQALVGRRPERVGRLVLTSCDAFENYPPKAVAYLKPTSHFPPALWLLTQTMRLRFFQRLPIAYGWATNAPIEPAIMESFLGSLRSNAGVRRDFAALDDGGQTDIARVAATQNHRIDRLTAELATLREHIASAEDDVRQSLRNVAVVRYDAFGDMGGRLSFSAAIVDDLGDGIVISSIHARGESRTYAKGIVGGRSSITLTPEEQQALASATTDEPGSSRPVRPVGSSDRSKDAS